MFSGASEGCRSVTCSSGGIMGFPVAFQGVSKDFSESQRGYSLFQGRFRGFRCDFGSYREFLMVYQRVSKKVSGVFCMIIEDRKRFSTIERYSLLMLRRTKIAM